MRAKPRSTESIGHNLHTPRRKTVVGTKLLSKTWAKLISGMARVGLIGPTPMCAWPCESLLLFQNGGTFFVE